MSDGDDLSTARTVHIEIPGYAPADEVEAFEDALADFVMGWKAPSPWDPHMHSHKGSCEESDHCYGPGSKAEALIVKRAKERA